MAKPDEFNNEVNSIGGSREFTSQEDPGIDLTQKNIRSEYDGPPTSDVSYGEGATGSVSSAGRQTSGGGSGIAPFIHPFKLERVLDPDDPTSTKVRIYEGSVYAKIDTFELDLITITTGASHTHSAGGYTLPEHQHSAYDSSDSNKQLTIPDHKHEAGSSSTNLKAANHTHGFGVTVNTNTVSNSGGSDTCHDTGHYHQVAISQTTGNISSGTSLDVSGETTGVKDYSSDADQKKVAGNTADVVPQSGSLPPITGTSGTNSNSSVTHKFVAVKGQAQAPVSPVAANFTSTFNTSVLFDDGTNTSFKYHETSHSDGDFYVKWVITITAAAAVSTVVGSIERVAVGAGAPADVPFGDLNQDSTTKRLSRTDPTFNGSNDTTKLVGTFHQKIGSVTSSAVDQVQFSNINWSMTVLPEVS